MFFYLFFSGRSAMSADLLPPYYLSSNNVSGSWQFSGSSIVQEEYVLLVPPIQFYRGCAWSIVPPPSKDWQIYFSLNITIETGGGGFCIWLIESHGAEGPFYGGPKQFKGIGLVGYVSEPNFLKLKLVESSGNETFSTFDSKSDDYDFIYDIKNETFFLIMDIFSDKKNESIKNINISFINEDLVSTKALSRRINVSIGHSWLGITASNEEKASRIILYSARFSIFDPIVAMQHGRQKKVSIRGSSHLISPENMPEKLRNPAFQKMNEEIAMFKKKKGQIQHEIDLYKSNKSGDVLSLIDEINDAFGDLAKYKNLNNFLVKTITPYAEKWQRRTFKIISTSNNSSMLFSECFNKTKTLLSIFNQSIVSTVQKADSKISRLNDLLFENIVEFAANNQKLNSEVVEETNFVWISFLKYISIVEVLVLSVFFCFYINRKQRF